MAQSTLSIDRKRKATIFIEKFVQHLPQLLEDLRNSNQNLKKRDAVAGAAGNGVGAGFSLAGLFVPGVNLLTYPAKKSVKFGIKKIWNTTDKNSKSDAIESCLDDPVNNKFTIAEKQISTKKRQKLLIAAGVEIFQIFELQIATAEEKVLGDLAKEAGERALAYIIKNEEKVENYVSVNGHESLAEIIVYGVIVGKGVRKFGNSQVLGAIKGKFNDGSKNLTTDSVVVNTKADEINGLYFKINVDVIQMTEYSTRLISTFESNNFENFFLTNYELKMSPITDLIVNEYSTKEFIEDLKEDILNTFQCKTIDHVLEVLDKVDQNMKEKIQMMWKKITEIEENIDSHRKNYTFNGWCKIIDDQNKIVKEFEDLLCKLGTFQKVSENEIAELHTNIDNVKADLSKMKIKIESLNKRVETLEQNNYEIDPTKIKFLPPIPKPNSNFVKRSSLLENVCRLLTTEPESEQRIFYPIVVLHAAGGYGKTQLSKSAAQECGRKFDHILWFDCESEGNVKNSILNHISNVDLTSKEKLGVYTLKQLGEKFYAKISFYKLNCLFIFDNVQDFELLKSYLPLNYCREDFKISVLISSRELWERESWSAYGHVENVKAENLTQEESMIFAKTILKGEPEGIQDLIEKSERIALILGVLVNSYESWRTDLKLAGKQLTIREFLEGLAQFECVTECEKTEENKNFINGICYAVSLIAKKVPFGLLAKIILDRIAYLDPICIESEFVTMIKSVKAETENLAKKRYRMRKLDPEMVVRKALEILENFGLLQCNYYNYKPQCKIVIHRMVQECVGYMVERDEGMKQDTEFLLSEIIEIHPNIHSPPKNIKRLVSHMIRIWPNEETSVKIFMKHYSKSTALITPLLGYQNFLEKLIKYMVENFGLIKAVDEVIKSGALAHAIYQKQFVILDLYCDTIKKYIDSGEPNLYEEKIHKKMCCFFRCQMDLKVVEKCISKCSVDINYKSLFWHNFLYLAVGENDCAKVSWLLAQGAIILPDVWGKVNSVEIFKELDNRINLSEKIQINCTKLLCGDNCTNLEYIKMLILEKGADPSALDEKFGLNALHYAANNGQPDVCELILKYRPEILYNLSKSGHTVIHFARRELFYLYTSTDVRGNIVHDKKYINSRPCEPLMVTVFDEPSQLQDYENEEDFKKTFQRLLNHLRDKLRRREENPLWDINQRHTRTRLRCLYTLNLQ